ncbi:MAG: YcbK family protein [Candidatus Eisenbacteria bacterium]
MTRLRPTGTLPLLRTACAWLLALAVAAAGTVLPVRLHPEADADPLSMAGPMPLYEQLVRGWMGASGNLRAVMATGDADWLDPWLKTAGITPSAGLPGVHLLKWTAPDGLPLVLLRLVPFDVKQGSFVGPYHVGRWPAERHPATAPNSLPNGFIVVTPENQDTYVSTRFRLRDFVTHDQDAVWPKYLVLRTQLLDKLELIAQELEREGKPARIEVLSGFRSPQYNAQGVGRRGGRARDSQHMYGDAADIYVDADGDGRMDDLDGDGHVTVRDARVLVAIAERVEDEHPELVGGLAAYRPLGSHGPFVHVDTRGWRARW